MTWDSYEGDRWPRAITLPLCFLTGIAIWVVLYILFQALVGCTTPPKGPLPGPLASQLPGSLAAAQERDLGEALAGRFALRSLDIEPVQGLVRDLHGRTACDPIGGVNPYVHLPLATPTAGELVSILFVTRHGGVPPPPSEACWMVWSFTPLATPVDFSSFGMPGCQLLVRPDNIDSVPVGSASGVLRRDGGMVWFEWLPPTWSTGTHLFLQLLVAAPGETSSGFLSSHAVEVIVGSPR